jgi:hypothetical protein
VTVIKILKNVAIAAAAVTLTSTAVLAQANLTFHTAGSGTPVALTATALVEYAGDRGIANIQTVLSCNMIRYSRNNMTSGQRF